MERYIILNLSKHDRSILAQLRLGVLPLEIEVGRYRGTELKDRLCKICNSGEIETEEHFIMSCRVFSSYRDKLFQDCNLVLSGNVENDFIQLMSNEKNIRPLITYLKRSYKARQDIMYIK